MMTVTPRRHFQLAAGVGVIAILFATVPAAA